MSNTFLMFLNFLKNSSNIFVKTSQYETVPPHCKINCTVPKFLGNFNSQNFLHDSNSKMSFNRISYTNFYGYRYMKISQESEISRKSLVTLQVFLQCSIDQSEVNINKYFLISIMIIDMSYKKLLARFISIQL